MIGNFRLLLIVLGACSSTRAVAQDTTTFAGTDRPGFTATGSYYLLPNASNTTVFVVSCDYKNWHGELRYNYEDIHTVSFFTGRTLELGKKVKASLTPLIGIVAGRTNAIAPGLETELKYSMLDLYAESEYIFDFRGDNNYLYIWSELGINPFKTFRAGISAQRTRAYETKFDVQRGLFVSYGFRHLTPSVHFFNPGSPHHFFIITLNCAL